MKIGKFNLMRLNVMTFRELFCSFQLRVISDMQSKQSVHTLAFVDVILTDFYVVIADGLDTVSNKCLNQSNCSRHSISPL